MNLYQAFFWNASVLQAQQYISVNKGARQNLMAGHPLSDVLSILFKANSKVILIMVRLI